MKREVLDAQSAHLPSRLSQIDSLVGCKKQANASAVGAPTDVLLKYLVNNGQLAERELEQGSRQLEQEQSGQFERQLARAGLDERRCASLENILQALGGSEPTAEHSADFG